MKSRVCDLLGIKYPIIQGAMAWIADASLASAASNAGGLGIIAAGNAPADVIRVQIKKLKEMTDKPYGVNVMLLSPFVDEIAQLTYEEKVPVVTTGAGNPGKYMDKWKEIGTKVIPVVPSVALAKRMEKGGADAIICEGMEAGGHVGQLTTMTLVPQCVDAVQIPVIAAGGIADGRGMAASFMLGAEAVQVGTRFLVAHECTVHEKYKKMVLDANDIETIVTGQITGHPVRVFKNKLSRHMIQLENDRSKTKEQIAAELEELGAGALKKSVVDGDMDFGSVMAGQIAGLVKKEQSCKEMIEELMAECQALLK